MTSRPKRPSRCLIFALALGGLLGACGATSTAPTRARDAIEPRPRIALPAVTAAPIASEPTVDARGWTHYPRRPITDLPPEVDVASLPDDWMGVPDPVVRAYAFLAGLGLPRLSAPELRDAIVLGDSWDLGHTRRVRTLVELAADGAPWVVYDTLLRPVVAVGPELDLEAECERAVELLERAASGDRDPDLRAAAHEHCPMDEVWPVLSERARPDLVERYFATRPWQIDRFYVSRSLVSWMLALHRRAANLYARGADRRARVELAELERLLPVAAEVVSPELQHHWQSLPRLHDQLARALAQHEHHASCEPASARVEGLTDVAALLEALGELDANERPPGCFSLEHPGRQLSAAPLVRALVAAGEPALAPLLRCVETDARSTRSVVVHSERSEVIPAYAVCYQAIATLLEHDFLGYGSSVLVLHLDATERRAEVVAAIRAYLDARPPPTAP